MLLIAFLLLAFVVVLVAGRLRAAGAVETTSLGRMSERWIAEYRASHST